MDFKLSDVRDRACVYLEGARENFEKFQLEIGGDFKWSDDLWDYVDHFYIEYECNSWTVYEFNRGDGYIKKQGITADEVITLIHELRRDVPIYEIM
jgi:hypothetical protein